MSAVPFDTLKLADRLQAGGFSAEQSRAAASALAEAMSGADLATKNDLAPLATKSDIADAKADTLKAVIGLLIGAVTLNAAVVVGAMFGLAKLLGH
jgi:hypothetical protein